MPDEGFGRYTKPGWERWLETMKIAHLPANRMLALTNASDANTARGSGDAAAPPPAAKAKATAAGQPTRKRGRRAG